MADERELGREYVLHEEIGRGAMAVVHRATSRFGGPDLAAKIIRPECADPRVRELFVREEAALRALQHESVVGVRDLVVEGGRIALLMELVDGPNLRRHLTGRGGRLLPAEAMAVARPVAQALAFAHAHGIVHLDVKPENILLTRDGRAKLGDFGLAAILHGSSATARGGTPAYMPPELADGERATTAADVYALGVLVAEMITGTRPVGADLSEVPPSLRNLVAACLSPDPGRRPSAGAVAAQLDSPISLHQHQITRPRRPAAPPPLTKPSRPNRRVVLIAAGAALFAALAGAVVTGGILTQQAMADTRTPAPSPSPSPTTAPTTSSPRPEPPAAPDRATYAEHLPNDEGTLYIAVHDGTAIAYLCDGKRVEAWFSGPATGGTLDLTSKKGGTLTGTYNVSTATGTVEAAGRTTDFTLPNTNGTATAFRSLATVNGAKVKGSWIILPSGEQVGVLTIDEAPQPAPDLNTTTGTADLNGTELETTQIDVESGEGF